MKITVKRILNHLTIETTIDLSFEELDRPDKYIIVSGIIESIAEEEVK